MTLTLHPSLATQFKMKSLLLFFFIVIFHTVTLLGFDYAGFNLDDTLLQNNPTAREILRQHFRKQVDVVNSIPFPSYLCNLLHQISITGVITYLNTDSSTGTKIDSHFTARYYPLVIFFKGSYIELNASLCSNPSPMADTTLLHEFMHGIHDIYISGGYLNTQIIKFYNDAKQRHCYGYSDALASCSGIYSLTPYPHTEYLFTNSKEFFACTAVSYLYGKSNMHPFSREEIQEEQPEYEAFLQELFDPNTSLEHSEFNALNHWHHLESSAY